MASANVIWVSAGAGVGGNGSEALPFSSINAALKHAVPGATIQVKAGTYIENVTVRASGTFEAPIKIVSADGPGKAVIKPASHNLDTINMGGIDHVQISGFTIHAPNTEKNGIHIYGKAGEDTFNAASHIVVENNTIIGGAGDGIKGSKAEFLTLRNNIIKGLTAKESGIDFVGVNHSAIEGNKITDINNIGVMIKGGSTNILVKDNLVSGTGSSGIEIGGYTEPSRYWPGFAGTYEAKGVRVLGNDIENTGGTGLRLIGAQDVEVAGNEVRNARNYVVSVDDSSAYHATWLSRGINFSGNSFDRTEWLKNRSAGSDIAVSHNYTDGRDLDARDEGLTLPGVRVEKVQYGSSANDTIKASALNNVIDGKSGSDKIYGMGGNDELRGGTGHDLIEGGKGSDRLLGGSGKDNLKGSDGNDQLLGEADADRLDGGRNSDLLDGGSGDDQLRGSDGDDILFGGAGKDLLIGGKGADTFVFRGEVGVDFVDDFSLSSDRVVFEISGVDGFADLAFRAFKGDVMVSIDKPEAALDLFILDGVKLSQIKSALFDFDL